MSRRATSATRVRLLDAASQLLLERGFASVTTRAIAERAGVNNALVHYHFGTKTALLAEAAVGCLDEEILDAARFLRDAPSLGAGVGAVLGWLGDLDLADPKMRLLLDLMIEALRDDEVGPIVAASLEAGRHELTAALVARDDVAAESAGPLAALLAALFDGVMLHRCLDVGLDISPWIVAARDAFQGDRPPTSSRRRTR